MIIKPADNQEPQLAGLKQLRDRPDVSSDAKRRIDLEIRNIRAGIRGEQEAAYEMDFYCGPSRNRMVIHDLRIECEGRVAQIDHLIVTRFLDIWVCESKSFAEGIAINERGEFAAFYDGRPVGVPSPLEQNRKHILVLEALFKTGVVKLPTRLGLNIIPSIKSIVLVSNRARVTRPKANIEGIDSIVKNDQFMSYLQKELEKDTNPLGIVKLISSETLEAFARELALQHKPMRFDWEAKFGLPKLVTPTTAGQAPERNKTETRGVAKSTGVSVKPVVSNSGKQSICEACGSEVSYAVVKFCRFNKAKFGGKLLCMDCQKK